MRGWEDEDGKMRGWEGERVRGWEGKMRGWENERVEGCVCVTVVSHTYCVILLAS